MSAGELRWTMTFCWLPVAVFLEMLLLRSTVRGMLLSLLARRGFRLANIALGRLLWLRVCLLIIWRRVCLLNNMLKFWMVLVSSRLSLAVLVKLVMTCVIVLCCVCELRLWAMLCRDPTTF